MSTSFTVTETKTFTVTHARYIAAKVAADLMRIKRLYGGLTDQEIDEYEEEIIYLLKAGYLAEVTYGFKRGDNWIEPTIRYTVEELLLGWNDDDPGRIRPRCDVSGAKFYSYLRYSIAWNKLPQCSGIVILAT
ncbi:hypothetical protein [Candidatus Thiodiazotropha sp. LNASS1]|uniref:HORMA-1 domain-containing protein n=1 Tax=Candidatus Thiodiazotropha sp. LNASS1 TaxID=3096260 RepID=UPI0034DEF8E4